MTRRSSSSWFRTDEISSAEVGSTLRTHFRLATGQNEIFPRKEVQ